MISDFRGGRGRGRTCEILKGLVKNRQSLSDVIYGSFLIATLYVCSFLDLTMNHSCEFIININKCFVFTISGVLSPSQTCIATSTAVGGGQGATSAASAGYMEAPHFSSHTWDKATKAKVTLENYYSNLISQHSERKQR